MVAWRQSEAEANPFEKRQSLLADASYTLASSLDYQTTLEQIVALPIPFLADWCAVDVPVQDGVTLRRAVAQADPTYARLEQQIEPQTKVSEKPERLPQDPRWSGSWSAVRVPLMARGRFLGNLILAIRGPDQAFDTDDLELLEQLAARAALALDNARLYSEQIEGTRRTDEFLAMLGHELRNPLAPILSALHTLQLRGVEDPSQRWAIGVVQRQATHLARLVDDLVEVSRITRGKIDLRKEPVELSFLLEKAAGTCRPQIEARRHELLLESEAQLWVEADPVRLEQILVSLLDNAAKYTEPGGRIRLSAERDKEEAVLRVRDTGMGLTPDILPRIWDLFSQGSRSLDRAQGGLGIGLTLVRSLVGMHGGSIQALSAGVNKGTEMVIRLPLRTEPVVQPEPVIQLEPSPVDTQHKVLVVDDNVDSAIGLGEVLQLWGYQVRIAHDGPTALTAAQEYTPQAILLDIGLPSMDGYEVARQLRQMTPFRNVLLVALTGYGQLEDQRLAKEAGFNLHYTKPVDLGALRQLLSQNRLPV